MEFALKGGFFLHFHVGAVEEVVVVDVAFAFLEFLEDVVGEETMVLFVEGKGRLVEGGGGKKDHIVADAQPLGSLVGVLDVHQRVAVASVAVER